jgi:hypothetical protein
MQVAASLKNFKWTPLAAGGGRMEARIEQIRWRRQRWARGVSGTTLVCGAVQVYCAEQMVRWMAGCGCRHLAWHSNYLTSGSRTCQAP